MADKKKSFDQWYQDVLGIECVGGQKCLDKKRRNAMKSTLTEEIREKAEKATQDRAEKTNSSLMTA